MTEKRTDAALIAALAGGATRAKAAEQAGVSESTVYRRLTDTGFCTRVQAARSEMVEQTSGRLAYLSTAAAMTLGKLLTASSETVRLGAARAILELGGKWRENEDLEARLSALEERLAVPPPGARPWAA